MKLLNLKECINPLFMKSGLGACGGFFVVKSFVPLFMKSGTGLFYWTWRMFNPQFMKSGFCRARQIFWGRGLKSVAEGGISLD